MVMTRPHGSMSHRPMCPTGPTCEGATGCARGEAFAELHETVDSDIRRANTAIPPRRHRLAGSISVQSSKFRLVGKVTHVRTYWAKATRSGLGLNSDDSQSFSRVR